jgi:hypothetical protein
MVGGGITLAIAIITIIVIAGCFYIRALQRDGSGNEKN